MKNVTYMGQTFSVPDEANFIAADFPSGEVYVFSATPRFDDGTWWKAEPYDFQLNVGRVDFRPTCEAC